MLRQDGRTSTATNLETLQTFQHLGHVRAGRPEHARRTAHVMVQEVESSAARAGALLQVPDAERAQRALQRVALEPVIEQLGNGHWQDACEIDHGLFAEAAHGEAQPADARQLGASAICPSASRARGLKTGRSSSPRMPRTEDARLSGSAAQLTLTNGRLARSEL